MPQPSQRIVIHAGFHKTGTSTVQKTLLKNNTLLAPHCRVFLRDDLPDACQSAREYAATPSTDTMADVATALTRFLQQLPADDPRPIIISAEDLSGLMPGRRGLLNYNAAPALMHAIQQGIQATIPNADLMFYFSIRDPDTWLRSCYGHHLRAARLTQDFTHYAQQQRPGADLHAAIADITRAVAPCPVHHAAIEDIADAPAAPLLALAGVPAHVVAALKPAPAANAAYPQETQDALLVLNRGGLNGAAYDSARASLLNRTTTTSKVHVIVHAGFHKTGTSSLQEYLKRHRDELRGFADIYLKNDFMDVGNLGRVYGLKPYPWRKRQFRRAFDRFIKTVPPSHTIVLSWEGLSGVMPGHRRLFTGTIQNFRRAAVPLGNEIVASIRARFGQDTDITYLYSLRERDSWIKSVYGHVVRSIRITDDFAGFRARLPDLPDLAQEAADIVAQLPDVALATSYLEDTSHTHSGPATAILDLIGVPDRVRNTLSVARPRNKGLPAYVEDAFLRLNRNVKNDADLKTQKDAIAAQAYKANQ